MPGVLPSYETPWEAYSNGHEELERRIKSILEGVQQGAPSIAGWAYAIVGTFGSGKTQLLYHITKQALAKGVPALYVFAEDFFYDILTDTSSRVWLPGDVAKLLDEKLGTARQSLVAKDRKGLEEVLRPRNADANQALDELLRLADESTVSTLPILLIDELEPQYRALQDRVQADERSPLRQWLEQKNHVKIVALAPAGIYEMGGADQGRVERLVIPPVDPWYIRDHHFSQEPGKANSAWWLTRGKPRHLFKAVQVLKMRGDRQLSSDEVLRLTRDELDQIGQEPSRVPAAILQGLPSTKYPALLDLTSVNDIRSRRMVIDVAAYDEGSAAEQLRRVFDTLDSSTATLISGYLRTVLRALSDGGRVVYLHLEDLPELLQITLDLLLEYEHASPGVGENLGDILKIYEAVDRPQLFAYLGHTWEEKDVEKVLPLTAGQLRDVFPFPVMNPTVKGHEPIAMRQKLEGKGLPIWQWRAGDNHIFVFASARDVETYIMTDAFRASVLADGAGSEFILPHDEVPEFKQGLFEWLSRNHKVSVGAASPLLVNFLLSVSGEVLERLPADLPEILQKLQEDQSDPLTSRKVQVYRQALQDLIETAVPRPVSMCGPLPIDATSLWGRAQVAEREISMLACALAFVNFTASEVEQAIKLREMFRGDREGRGAGPLRPFISRGGYSSLADDLLPTSGRRSQRGRHRVQGSERQPVQRLRSHFGVHEDRLRELARIVSLPDFLKIHGDEDQSRVLEALWRCVRREFVVEGYDELLDKLELEAVPTAQQAEQIQARLLNSVRVSGVGFGEAENIVRNRKALEEFLITAKEVSAANTEGSPLLKALYGLFLKQLVFNVEPGIRRIKPTLQLVDTSLENLEAARSALRKNFWEYRKAADFVAINDADLEQAIADSIEMEGTPPIEALAPEINDARDALEELSGNLRTVNLHLEELDTQFKHIGERD